MIIQDESLNFVEKGICAFEKENRLGSKFVIALDFDGVISYPYKLKTQYLNDLGYDIKEEQCGYEVFVRQLGNSQEDYERALFRAYTEKPGVLPLEHGFMSNFLKIKKLKDVLIFIITSRYDNMLKHLEEYLKYHQIKISAIINTKNKNKSEALEKINANVFVEDSPFRLKQIFSEKMEILKKCTFILLRNRANQVEKSPDDRILEVSTWDRLYQLIEKKHKEFFEG